MRVFVAYVLWLEVISSRFCFLMHYSDALWFSDVVYQLTVFDRS